MANGLGHLWLNGWGIYGFVGGAFMANTVIVTVSSEKKVFSMIS